MPSTYSRAWPQSRLALMLPSSSTSCWPRWILATERVILRVTNVSPELIFRCLEHYWDVQNEPTSSRTLVVEQNPIAAEHPVGLSVVDHDPIGVELRHRVGRARVERSCLPLRDLLHLAVELRGGGLVESDLPLQPTGMESVQQSECAHRIHLKPIPLLFHSFHKSIHLTSAVYSGRSKETFTCDCAAR